MTGALALVAALSLSSQIQTHPAGLDSIGPSRGRSLRTAPIMDKLYQQANKPALDFNFARFKDLHDDATGATSLVTFSRSAAQSPGTYVGADGLIHDAAVNLALYSEQFDNAAWTKSSVDVTANQAIAPDGKQTADKLIATQPFGVSVNRIYDVISGGRTLSVYAKAAEADAILIRTADGNSTLDYVVFDLTDGSGTATGTGHESFASENVGNGWFRVSVTSNQDFALIYLAVAGDNCANGNGIYIWGAQLEETDPATMAPTAYIHTTSQALAAPRFDHDPVTGESLGLLVEEQRTNLTLYSENLGSGWLFSTATVVLDQEVSPDGKQTADELVFSAVGGVGSTSARVYQQYLSLPSSTYTASVYVKAGSSNLVYFRKVDNTAGPVYDLSDGSLTAGSDAGCSLTSVGNGWWRFQSTLSSITTGIVYVANGSAVSPTGSVYVFGAQMEAGAFATSYIPTTGSAQTRYADVAAVQDEDFSTTNLISYSESFDVGWSTVRLRPIVPNATTAPDGTTTADYIEQVAANTNGGGAYQTTTYSGKNTLSVYAKAGEKSFIRLYDGGTVSSAYFDLLNGQAGSITGSGSSSITSVENGWYRCTFTTTYTGSNIFTVYLADTDGSTTVTDSGGVYVWGASVTNTEYPVEYTTTRNLLTDSQDFERSTWSLASATIGNDVAHAPDGTITADDATATGANATVRNATTTLAVSYTFSVWLKRKTGTGDIDISVDGTTWVTQSVTSAWQRFTVTQTGVAGTSNPGVRIVDSGDAVYLFGAQLEPGSTATDYVRTVDAVGKRYGWYEPTEGTIHGEFDRLRVAGSPVQSLVHFGDTGRIALYEHSGDFALSGFFTAGACGYAGSTCRHNGAYKYQSFATCMNGTCATNTSQTIQIVDLMRIGSRPSGPTDFINGHIKRLTYWPVRQSDTTLQVITQ